MASRPVSSTPASQGSGSQQGTGSSLLALFIYFGVLLLLLLVFAVIGFFAVSAPVPERIGFFPPM